MNRFCIFCALSTLLCFTFGLHTVHAEESKVDMSKCITLTVKQGAMIKLDFAASTAGVWVKVTGVKDEKVEEAPTKLHGYGEQPKYVATGTEIKVYGAIDKFTCYSNEENLTALDVAQNINLTYLECDRNQISSLDVTQNVNLVRLTCYGNKLSSLDVSKNAKLIRLDCYGNKLSSLDVSKNLNLEALYCGNNQLSTLDVTKNTNLSLLYCNDNQLLSLDVSKNVKLETILGCSGNQLSSIDISNNINLNALYCHDNQIASLDISKNIKLSELSLSNNNFSTSILNDVYCQLPNRVGEIQKGRIFLVQHSSDVLNEFLAKSACKSITDAKNWAIQYYQSDNDIENITGNYTCGSTYGLTLEPATIPSFTYQSGEWKTTVTSTGNWKLDETTPLPDWLSVEPKQGSNGSLVTVSAKPNTGNSMRRGALTFVLTDDANTKQVVLLKQAFPSIWVTPFKEYTFPTAGETKSFSVESSGAWTVNTSNAGWLTIEPKSGAAGTTTVTIKADANNNKEERSTELFFALKDNTEIKQVVTLKQKGALILVTSSAGYTFPTAGETKSFSVESSGAWTVSTSNAEWLTIEPKSGEAGTTTVTVKADANNNKEERSTELTFALNNNTEVKQVVRVKQAENPTAVEDVLFAGIWVAPNPFASQLRIKNEEAVNARYELVNTNGVAVRTGVLQGVETVLNTEKLPAGAYLLRILSGTDSKTLRVVKE